MPLPKSLQLLVRTRRFWTDSFWVTDRQENAYSEFESCVVDLPVAGGYGLSLSFGECLDYFSLGFVSPSTETVEIAYDDDGQQFPHALRWQELELICRTIALQDAELPHPGVLLLLLHRFAPICEGDDLDLIVPMLDAAWRQLDVFSDTEIQRLIEQADARDAGFAWRYEETVKAWCLEQDDHRSAGRSLYTYRTAENANFPFVNWGHMLAEANQVIMRARGGACDDARAFAETGDLTIVPQIIRSLRSENHSSMADAFGSEPPISRVCWIVETLLGSDPGSVLKRYVPRTHELREKYTLSLGLPLCDPKRPLPTTAGNIIADILDRILVDRNLGRAETGGGTLTPTEDGTYIDTEKRIDICINGDLEEGIRLVRDVLWWLRAPEPLRLQGEWQEEIPLELARKTQELGEACLQLSKFCTTWWEFDDEEIYHLDRIPLSQSCRDALRTVLADVRATGPDEDGWYSATMPDGGSVEICLHRLNEDSDLDACTVVLRRLSSEAAQFLYRLMSEGELILLPPAIATSAKEAETVTAPWPNVRVIQSASELHEILIRGPHEWWSTQRDEIARPDTL
jgi:hypothetical protein